MEKKIKIREILLIAAAFLFMILIIFLTPIFNKYGNSGELIINEVMTSNKYTISDSFGNYSDYIEIYNGYDYDMNLEGYYLSDNDLNTKKWLFPDVSIKAKSYLIVFASGKNIVNNGEIHTNFKLSSSGEVISLSDSHGKLLSKIKYHETISDSSYGYNGKDYVYYYNGTPGNDNHGEYDLKPIKLSNSDVDLKITEYITNNLSNVKSSDGKYYNMIEIYNNSDNDINLENYYLSDDLNNPIKYVFPNVIIKSKDYITVYTSSKNEYINNEIHTNFKLDNDDTFVVLSDKYQKEIDRVKIQKLEANVSMGIYEGEFHYYTNPTFGYENNNTYIEKIENVKDIIINEVSSIGTEAIEIKNITNKEINLSDYSIGDKSGYVMKFPNINIKPYGYVIIYGSDSYSYQSGKIYSGFHINNSTEMIYLYKNNLLIDEFYVGRMVNGVSVGIDNDGNRVLYKNITIGYENSKNIYSGYSMVPVFSKDGGYVEKNSKITLSSKDGSTIYYTTDGSFPTNKSQKYQDAIAINKTTVIKAISYKDGYIESEVVSRTFFVGREHDLPIISISTGQNDLNRLLINYNVEQEKKINFEFYESNGSLGVSFVGGTKLTGMDSRKRDQKSMAIYLRKEYGLKEVTYPFFKGSDVMTYSSFTLRNSGEDPYGIRIQDTTLTYALKDQMDIDMQDYRAVVVYLNGKYYGLYNMREKLNEDYLKSNYNLEKGSYDLIKYKTASSGTNKNYLNLVNYIKNNNTSNSEVYEYIKSQLDVQEFCNYLIVESYYANTDQGNIRYWKSYDGKWRFMLYDLDWSLWNTSVSMNYTVFNTKSPAVTYVSSVYDIARRLYKNSEFKDLYLKTLAYHLEHTFKPERMHGIIDELSKEIESEMPYHIERWPTMHSSMNNWYKNIDKFKSKLTNRYNYVIKNVKREFNLTDSEYQKYFGSL